MVYEPLEDLMRGGKDKIAQGTATIVLEGLLGFLLSIKDVEIGYLIAERLLSFFLVCLFTT